MPTKVMDQSTWQAYSKRLTPKLMTLDQKIKKLTESNLQIYHSFTLKSLYLSHSLFKNLLSFETFFFFFARPVINIYKKKKNRAKDYRRCQQSKKNQVRIKNQDRYPDDPPTTNLPTYAHIYNIYRIQNTYIYLIIRYLI